MAKKSVLLPNARSERPLPRLPHPSWRQAVAGGQGERRDLSADDFWSRLGL